MSIDTKKFLQKVRDNVGKMIISKQSFIFNGAEKIFLFNNVLIPQRSKVNKSPLTFPGIRLSPLLTKSAYDNGTLYMVLFDKHEIKKNIKVYKPILRALADLGVFEIDDKKVYVINSSNDLQNAKWFCMYELNIRVKKDLGNNIVVEIKPYSSSPINKSTKSCNTNVDIFSYKKNGVKRNVVNDMASYLKTLYLKDIKTTSQSINSPKSPTKSSSPTKDLLKYSSTLSQAKTSPKSRQMGGDTHDKYYAKYMKYKQKYLNLKKL